MNYQNTPDFAKEQDLKDPLKDFRQAFHIPEKSGKAVIYFCGNSLGLQPKSTAAFIEREMQKWREMGVEGHFKGDRPWVRYHELFKQPLAHLVGARSHEVVCMNNLTTNLHLLLASFYQPKDKKVKLMIEAGAFPSDHYAAESHMRQKGIDPDENLILLRPKSGETFETQEIAEAIQRHGDELALVLFPGIQYYTGQFFDLKTISQAAHEVGAYAGFDLAHAAGNLPMSLHDDHVDFAAWCSYKYLNSGPGGVSGAFIHEKHSNDPNFPKLTGWWGHEGKTRFQMDNQFVPAAGADAWMLSNMNIISSAAHLASLEIFENATMPVLRQKSLHLTGYLEFLLTNDPLINTNIKIITPTNPQARGCQLSIFLAKNGKDTYDGLMEHGVVLDWREPNVIRAAPTPLYNTFQEVYEFVNILKRQIERYQ